MRIVHIMADGTVKESVKGVVIQNKQFYTIYNELLKRSKQNGKV